MSLLPDHEPDIRTFWQAIGVRAVGVAIVTTLDVGQPAGFLALSASHLNATPPAMTVSVDAKTSALAGILRSKVFAINYLAADAMEVYERFTAHDGPKGAERFNGLDWSALSTGAPVLTGSIVGAIDCRLSEHLEIDGTILAVGRVVNHLAVDDRDPLIHFRGKLLGHT